MLRVVVVHLVHAVTTGIAPPASGEVNLRNLPGWVNSVFLIAPWRALGANCERAQPPPLHFQWCPVGQPYLEAVSWLPLNFPPSKPYTQSYRGPPKSVLLVFWKSFKIVVRLEKKVKFKLGSPGQLLKNDSCPYAERALPLYVLLTFSVQWATNSRAGCIQWSRETVKERNKWASHFWVKPWILAVSPEMDPGHTLSVVMKLKSEAGKVQMFVPH